MDAKKECEIFLISVLSNYDCKKYQSLSIPGVLTYFTTASQRHGGITEFFLRRTYDPRLGRLCGLVSNRFARVVGRVNLFFVEHILSAALR